MACGFCVVTREEYDEHNVGSSIFKYIKGLIVDACFRATNKPVKYMLFTNENT